MVNGTALVAAMDWLEAESTDRNSRFFDKVNVAPHGGDGHVLRRLDVLRRLERSARGDRRHLEQRPVRGRSATRKIYAGIHGPVIIVTGGESDIAYANGKRDFEVMPARIPVFYGVHPSVGHGGTYNQDNGGPFGVVAVAWLKWQLQGDTSAAGRGYFVGTTAGSARSSSWQIDSRTLP